MTEGGKQSTINSIDRAAVLLLALGERRAAQVLKHMGPKEVQAVGATMAGPSNITSDKVNGAFKSFVQTVHKHTAFGVDSDEYIRNVLTDALGADKAGSVIDRILLGRNSQGIEQLKWMDSRAIADLVRLEHPQIITNVVSLLDHDQSAEVLSYLPENMRSDIIMRVATLETMQPAALQELDTILEKQLNGNTNAKLSALGGLDTAASILNFLGVFMEAKIIEHITDNDAELAQEIQDKMFVFADFAAVDDRGIQTLLREISTDSLLLALRGDEDALREKIFENMSKRAAEMLREDLEAAAPAKLNDVEASQKEIVAIARRLEEAGQISLGGGSSDELAHLTHFQNRNLRTFYAGRCPIFLKVINLSHRSSFNPLARKPIQKPLDAGVTAIKQQGHVVEQVNRELIQSKSEWANACVKKGSYKKLMEKTAVQELCGQAQREQTEIDDRCNISFAIKNTRL